MQDHSITQNAGRCDICGKPIDMESGDRLVIQEAEMPDDVGEEYGLSVADAAEAIADALERVGDGGADYELARVMREDHAFAVHGDCLDETNFSELQTGLAAPQVLDADDVDAETLPDGGRLEHDDWGPREYVGDEDYHHWVSEDTEMVVRGHPVNVAYHGDKFDLGYEDCVEMQLGELVGKHVFRFHTPDGETTIEVAPTSNGPRSWGVYDAWGEAAEFSSVGSDTDAGVYRYVFPSTDDRGSHNVALRVPTYPGVEGGDHGAE
ncbi:hypothetical protein [Halostella litorea]|uniref:hypothetical protein n=1 Tax=Halostella litorea TaxID=2528831 RepID=UPI0010926021|nr:hypothetical protein [Halostella litorea]